ncbi:MAG: HEAT repeat domain-containing protein [Deltaproteobacteria bacterium]|nr:HEAT repeat domain-containing protein [Deltaproteobacteria bacterium]
MALQALENIDSKLLQDPQVLELIPSLIDQLYSEYPLVIRDAIVALEKIKDPRSIRPLIGLLDNESEFVKLNAYSALKKVTGEDFGINVLKWQKWLDQTA